MRKQTKNNKKGISLIVLVITIIVMIILAAAVILSLSSSGIINRANEAVDKTNEKQMQTLAATLWAEAYMDYTEGKITEAELIQKVKDGLYDADKDYESKYDVEITKDKVTLTAKGEGGVENTGTTLGSLITSKEDYGKTIDYTVTVDGTEYTDWQIFYEDEANGYVFIISTNNVGDTTLDEGITVSSLTAEELELYSKFQVGNWPKYTLKDTDADGNTMKNCQAVAQLIKNYSAYANTADYGSNVIGAIGGPTLELLAAGWNAKNYEPTMELTKGDNGYMINGSYDLSVTGDGLYVPSDYIYWLASPSARDYIIGLYAGYDSVGFIGYYYANGVRPVVCLSSNIPAETGTTTDFSLIK